MRLIIHQSWEFILNTSLFIIKEISVKYSSYSFNIISIMGCTDSKDFIPPIASPEGNPIDPLLADGNIIDNILLDPHIHFFQTKFKEVILPMCKKKNSSGSTQNK